MTPRRCSSNLRGRLEKHARFGGHALLPISKGLPPVDQWRIRRRILRWHKDPKWIDLELEQPIAQRLRKLSAMIDAIEKDCACTSQCFRPNWNA